MTLLDAILISALIATAWTALYACADRLVADARSGPARPVEPHLLRWARLRLAAFRRGRGLR